MLKSNSIPLDKNFLLQYYARDIQERLVDADLSNMGSSIRVGGLVIEVKFFCGVRICYRIRKFDACFSFVRFNLEKDSISF